VDLIVNPQAEILDLMRAKFTSLEVSEWNQRKKLKTLVFLPVEVEEFTLMLIVCICNGNHVFEPMASQPRIISIKKI